MTTIASTSPTALTTATSPGNASAGPTAVQVSQLIAQLHSSQEDVANSARALLAQLVTQQPANPVVQLGWGIALVLQGQPDKARVHFEKAVAIDGKFGSAWSGLGNIHKLQGRLKQAREMYEKAIAVQPDLADAHFNLAQVDEAEGDYEAAEKSLRRALLFNPGYSEAHNNLGRLLIHTGKVAQAVSHFRQALGANPGLRQARDNLIMSLYRLGRGTEAQAEVDQLLAANPDDVHVLRVQAAGLAQRGHMDEAEAINRKLLELQPEAPDLQWNLGEVMLQRDDYEGALACYREMLSKRNIHPALAIGAMANVMFVQGNFSGARDLYQQALGLDARHPRLLLGLAKTLLAIGETRQGLETLKHAITVLPKAADVHSQYLLALRLDPACTEATHGAEAQRWLQAHAPEICSAPAPRQRKEGEALRLGLLVGDLEKGPVHAALASLIPALDPHETDLYVYHAARSGNAAQALQNITPHWRPVASLGDADLVQQMREDGLDVLLDMVGHGPGGRLPALAQRAAPVQWGWMGEATEASLAIWDGTLGNEGTDRPLHAWFPWTAPADAPEAGPLPLLTQGHATLGVVAPLAHIQAETLDAWAQILQALPEARLLILSQTAEADETTRQRIQRLMLLRDVEPERVEIVPRLDTTHTWQALARMDAVLDSFPVPMGPDAVLNCLWMGLPVLALSGMQPWQQGTSGLLAQAGLQDHAASDVAHYVEQAINMVRDPQSLTALRSSLRERLRASPCMDAAAFARDFSAALRPRNAA